MNLPEQELKALEWWRSEKIFERSLEKESPQGAFVFYEGPPTANGKPGIHHVISRAFKDIIPRFKTMQGYRVVRKGGWDTHGLPVELEVEKALGLKSKKEVEEYGIGKFNEQCRASVWKYKEEWEKFTERMGFWLDLEHAYITYEGRYINALWGVIKKFWERGLLVEGHKVVPHCPRCGTALSSHELAQGYQTVKDMSLIVKFQVTSNKVQTNSKFQIPNFPIYILSWTTTPWTLPGNAALAVGKDIEYVVARITNIELGITEYVIVAKERLSIIEGEHEVVRELKGSDLVGLEYESLFDIPALKSPTSYKIYHADFVSTAEGTGVVHTAVMYGEDDYRLGTEIGLPKVHTVSEDGLFNENAPAFMRGKFVKDTKTEKSIIEDLEKRGLIFKKELYEHDYPYCWRCKTPLLYYAKHSWFVAMSTLRNELIEANDSINWTPSYIKEGRFGEWLREVKDWAFSRERYWGTPLPIWRCQIGTSQIPDPAGEQVPCGAGLKSQINSSDQISNGTRHPDRSGGIPRHARDDGQYCGRVEVIGSIAELVKKTKFRNRYIFMRHGEAESNLKDVCNNTLEESPKYPLTQKGEKQVREAAEKLKKEKIDIIITSDFHRTMQTARIVGEAFGKEVISDARIREYDVGSAYKGAPVEKVEHELGDGQARLAAYAEGGETLGEVLQRMVEAVKEHEAKEQGKTILFVSHGDPLWVLQWALSGSLESIRGYPYPQFADPKAVERGVFLTDARGELDLHRPRVDEITLPCECGGTMRRVPEVTDVWFDSGAMPFAQYSENVEALGTTPSPSEDTLGLLNSSPFLGRGISPQDLPPRKEGDGGRGVSLKQFPADYISEAIDQTRGWFYTLLAVSVALGRGAPYKNVICLGHILDAKGKKMSKSLGNIVVPGEMFEKYGADPVRWYLYTMNDPGQPKRFDEKDLGEVVKKFFLILWNVVSFHELYPPQESPKSKVQSSKLHVLDQWILARLAQLTALVTERLEIYDVTPAGRAIQEFVTDLSTWYVRRSRERMKAGNGEKSQITNHKSQIDGEQARQTLRYVLVELSKLIAPFVPFTADALWQRLMRPTPAREAGHPSSGGESPLERSRPEDGGVSSVHLADWPQWSEVDEKVLTHMVAVRGIVEQGLAARAAAKMPIRQPLRSVKIKNIESGIQEKFLEILKEELNVKEVSIEKGKGEVKVELDTTLTEELKLEGMKRELIRAVNNLRKHAKLTINDRIVLHIKKTEATAKILQDFKEELLAATLATDIHASDSVEASEKGTVVLEDKEVEFGF